ncbi:MAG: 16S rRNA (uracil(1498)-N(3))-methyltransferase [Bacteroidetes bacterium]|nr:16S rRNA (uracil(1498)-N(3))-methyltransferase [Bacteroidota bacterium]
MHLFYAPDIGNSLFYELSRDESHHAIKVLRLHKNEMIRLTDGKGNRFLATILEPSPGKCYVAIKEMKNYVEKRIYHLHIAIAPPKNINRFEIFLEKATETGIDEITPLICERSERKLFNHERMEKILISAMKQAERSIKPKLHKFISLSEFVKISSSSATGKYIASNAAENKKSLFQCYAKERKAVVLIGPEGDFTSTEILQALKAGFTPVSLGEYRLRTETAGIVITSFIASQNY